MLNRNIENFDQFLIWLYKIKDFDAMAIIRVVKEPHLYNELYEKFLEFIS